MTEEYTDVLVQPTEGEEGFVELELNPQGAPSDADQTPEGTDPEAQPAGDTAGAGKPASRTVPLERFDEVNARLQELRKYEALIQTIGDNPDDLAEAQAAVLNKRLGRQPAAQPEAVKPVAAQPAAPAIDMARLQQDLGMDERQLQALAYFTQTIANANKPADHGPETARDVALLRYEARNATDDLYRSIRPQFQNVIHAIPASHFAGKTAKEIDDMIETAYDATLGRQTRAAAEAMRRNRKPDVAPNYSGGGGPTGGPRKVRVPKEVLEVGRAGGLTDREIAEEWEQNNG